MRRYWTTGESGLMRTTQHALLALPWCGPPPGAAHDPTARAIRPGEVLLLTVGDAGDGGGVWRTLLARDAQGTAVPFVDTAVKAARAAETLAARTLPRTLPPPDQRLAERADPVWVLDRPRVIDGASIGLAMALAAASLLLDAPVPASWAASATVDADGRLGPVQGLSAKIAAVYEGCPAVTRILVAASQRDEVAALRPLADDADVQIVGVETLEQAFKEVFGDVDALARARLDKAPSAASRHLWDRTLGRVDSRWRQVAETAHYLRQRDDVDGFRLNVVERIARRHAGERDVLLPWIDRSHVPHREPWLKLVAHAVQSAADAGEDDALREYLRRAEAELRPLVERSPAEIELAGACGRGWAALGEAGRAEAHLREATEAWFQHGLPAQASLPLCEWLRVTAAFRLANAAEVIGRATRILRDVPFDERSAAYLHLELARALLLTDGDASKAAEHAHAARAAARAGSHPGPAARRWLVRALRALGRDPEADAELAALRDLAQAQGADPTARTAPLLAILDRIAVQGGDLTGTAALDALAELRAEWPVEAHHAARVAGDAGVARYFRY